MPGSAGPDAPLESRRKPALSLCPSRGMSPFVQNPRLSGRKEHGECRWGTKPELQGPKYSRGRGAVNALPSCCLRARGQGQGLPSLTCAPLPLKQGQALLGHPAARGSPTPSCRRQLDGDPPPGSLAHVPGIMGDTQGEASQGGWSAPCRVAQHLRCTYVHLWPGGGAEKAAHLTWRHRSCRTSRPCSA